MGIAVPGHGEVRGSSVVAVVISAVMCVFGSPAFAANDGLVQPSLAAPRVRPQRPRRDAAAFPLNVRAAIPGILQGVIAVAGVLFALVAGPTHGQDAKASEQQVKAAYLFKFGGYVEWPADAFADAASPVVIGVAGDEALGREVAKVVANRSINGRPVSVHVLRAGEAVPRVHILFVARSQLARIAEITGAIQSALIVTDTDKGLEQGSTINFVNAENRIRFEVSLEAAKRGGIKIGAPLLSVAMRVQG